MTSYREGLLAQEFADLCGVSKDTLLYYDRIGLFQPALVAENGYRVYSLDQVHTFDLLLLLRDSHLPLRQMKQYLQNQDPVTMLALLRSRSSALQQEIAQMERLRQRLEFTALQMERGMTSTGREPKICVCEEEQYIVVTVDSETLHDRRARMTAVRAFLHACQAKELQGDYLRCAVISKDRLLRGCFDKTWFCVRTDSPVPPGCTDVLTLTQPKGTYAVMRHVGSYQDLHRSYAQLLDYIAGQNRSIRGNAYERELMGYICRRDDSDYVIEIAIEVDP